MKCGIFKVEYVRISQGKRIVTKRIYHLIKEYRYNKENETALFLEHKRIYKDFNYYFCSVNENEQYYYFNTSKNKVIISWERINFG